MKTVVIIGASGGIGKEICKAFYKKGFNIIAGYCNNKNEVEKLYQKFNYKENRICPLQINIENNESVKHFFEETTSIFGKIDVLINCAGVSFPNLLIDCNDDNIIKEINTNLLGTIFACREAVKIMMNFSGGKIINIASIWGVVGGTCESTYSASKAGLIGFSKALAKEVGSAKITVNCISPGAIKTHMNKHLTKADYADIISATPLNMLPTAKDVAKCAIFLANANSITGQNIVIDGGFTL